MPRLRILIANATLVHPSGSDAFARDLALGLPARGHTPIAYAASMGSVAEELRCANIPVTQNLDALGTAPDVILGHHHAETFTALLRFLDTPAVYFCHGLADGQQVPPRFPRIVRYLVPDEAGRERLVCEAGIPPEAIRVVPFAGQDAVDRIAAIAQEAVQAFAAAIKPDCSAEGRAAAAYVRWASPAFQQGMADAARRECGQLRSQRDQLRSERDALRAERDSLAAECDRVRALFDFFKFEHDLIKPERDFLHREYERLKALESQYESLRAERDRLHAECASRASEAERLKFALEDVYASVAVRMRDGMLGVPVLGSITRSAARQALALKRWIGGPKGSQVPTQDGSCGHPERMAG